MEQCTPEAVQKLSSLVDRLEADMGGTQMEQAVVSTCKEVSVPEKNAPSLLLITDDLYWNNGSLLREARESGHRIFTIGVGSAPAECLLRQLAEQTGGACEFVTPNEDMAGVIVRMFRRMRGPQTNKLSIDWGSVPIWQSPLPLSIFDGDTLHLFATFAETPTRKPTLSWDADGKTESASPEMITGTENRDLARLGAAQRMQTLGKPEALAMALKYQLVSDQSSLFLVYLREGEDKVTELPEIHQVPQMMAKGSHGFGSVAGGGFVGGFGMFCAISAPLGGFPGNGLLRKAVSAVTDMVTDRMESSNNALSPETGSLAAPQEQRVNVEAALN
jgi:Ca-activated chloride channel family protein